MYTVSYIQEILYYISCRYTVTSNLGCNHLILGKKLDHNSLSEEDVIAIKQLLPNAYIKKAIVYNRVLISGIIYATTAYNSSTLRNDSVVCLYKDNVHIFGIAKLYVSFANEDSISNEHVILICGLEILSDSIGTDVITGATARHLRCVRLLRLVNSIPLYVVL